MDLTGLLAAILTVNLAVFLVGCLLAAFRTWGPLASGRRRSRRTEGGVRR